MKFSSILLVPLIVIGSGVPQAFAAQHYVVTPIPGRQAAAEPEPPIVLTLTEGSLPQAIRNKPFSYAFAHHLEVTGDPAYQQGSATFTARGALPSGLELSSQGTVTGTPTQKGGGQAINVSAHYKTESTDHTYTIDVNSVPLEVTAVAAGYTSACAITPAGAAKCWGMRYLGNGVNDASQYPVQVTGLESGVTKIAMALEHTCAIQNGAAKCWGVGSYGRLGSGNLADALAPVQVVGLESGVTALGMGPDFSCAVQFGALKCWGYGTLGAMGDGVGYGVYTTPVQVKGLTSGVTAVDATSYQVCAVQNGAAKCWGTGSFGVLGAGSAYMGGSNVPVQVSGMTSGVTDIAVSSRNVCALRNGAVSCWGSGDTGKLGSGATQDTNVPAAVPSLSAGVTKIAANGANICAEHYGVIKCWGSTSYGHIPAQPGSTFAPLPVAVEGISGGVSQLVLGTLNVCVVHQGHAKCWGNSFGGTFGNGEAAGKHTVPQTVQE